MENPKYRELKVQRFSDLLPSDKVDSLENPKYRELKVDVLATNPVALLRFIGKSQV